MASCHQGPHHSEEVKRVLLTRLKRIEGQIRGISRMIEEDQYCDDILNQITAVRSALAGVQEKLLIAHLRSCVSEQIRQGHGEAIDEVAQTLRRMLK
ncbi:metal-sensitive transcriptional regulator [Thermospira aquatica]|uniref:Metal-sensitive transcriptional regulator n=1 Tax=Thermospira aquatica TaxID=2828656 RepID=A0AAX3BFW1_9SPIR|nr:metal-sensitive transcriptional regulator [Thermospira aquatica]URA11141.1 metal-sensitive transcriptional regulator [Thermospira aquatica]